MNKIRIKKMNKIAKEGLNLFTDHYSVEADEQNPEGIIVRSSQVDTDAYPDLIAVARAGAGVNNITIEKATAKGVCVFNTPGANANAVAELVFVMLGIEARNIQKCFDFCRGLSGSDDEEIAREVEMQKSAFRGVELAGKTFGVIGLGKIGVRVANGGVLRQMKVISFDPAPALENIHLLSPEVIVSRSLEDVVRQANILSVHIPLTSKTKDFVNSSLIERLPVGAIIVNYARGPIVDDNAVLTALNDGKLSSYITDFPNKLLLSHPKVLSSPHLGASTEESEEQCASMAVNEIKSYFEYGNVINSVNFPLVESIPSASVHTRLIMINRDIPGMIGFASHTIGSRGINIHSYLNESNGKIGYNIIDLEQAIGEDVLISINSHPDVIRTRTIVYKN